MFVTFLQVLLLITPILAMNYDFTFEKLVADPVKNPIATVDISVKKENGTLFKVSGTLNQLIALDDTYNVQVSLLYDARNRSDLRTLASLPKVGVCVMMKTLYKEFLFEVLTKACTNAPDPKTCPLPPKKYEIKNMKLDLKNFTDFFLPGYYEFSLEVFKNEKFQAKFSLFGSAKRLKIVVQVYLHNLVPRKKRRDAKTKKGQLVDAN